MLKEFQLLQQFITEVNESNQTTHKLAVLKRYADNEFIQKVLHYTYNPLFQYYVTPETLEKNYEEDLGTLYQFSNLFEMLDCLRSREVTGHKAINSVNDFCYQYEESKDLIYKIIGKDLEIRMGDTLINKVIPNLIPTFDVALATPFEDVNPDLNKSAYFASRKMDGVRCLAIIDDKGKCTLWSRQGKQFDTLQLIVNDIESLGLKSIVLDGEICLATKDGADDFQSVMKEIRRKNHTIQNPKFLMFDCIDLADFSAKKGNKPLLERLEQLQSIIPDSYERLSILEQNIIKDYSQLEELLNDANSKGWEGLILRNNVGYEGKRSKNMLKCKTFQDSEYVVTGIEYGPFRIIENGIEKTIDTVSNIKIKHKGSDVSVGSGFSLEQRMDYFENPESILGKTITVKYFQETINKDGKYSLRFPTLKHVYENGRTV
jgi:DNA ligase-1